MTDQENIANSWLDHTTFRLPASATPLPIKTQARANTGSRVRRRETSRINNSKDSGFPVPLVTIKTIGEVIRRKIPVLQFSDKPCDSCVNLLTENLFFLSVTFRATPPNSHPCVTHKNQNRLSQAHINRILPLSMFELTPLLHPLHWRQQQLINAPQPGHPKPFIESCGVRHSS